MAVRQVLVELCLLVGGCYVLALHGNRSSTLYEARTFWCHETSHVVRQLGWHTAIHLVDYDSADPWMSSCLAGLGLKQQVRYLCRHGQVVADGDSLCRTLRKHGRTPNVFLQVSVACMINFLKQVHALENSCIGLMTFRSRWFAFTQEKFGASFANTGIPLYHLLLMEVTLASPYVSLRTSVLPPNRNGTFDKMVEITWKAQGSLQKEETFYPNVLCGFCKRHFYAVTNKWATFIMGADGTGNARFDGYVIRLVAQIAYHLNFTYTLYEPADLAWGAFRNGSWTGMVGELVRRKADFAAGPLSMTEAREKVVDYTLPIYWNRALVFLPASQSVNDRLYLKPFKHHVWIALICSLFLGAFTYYILSSFSPAEGKLPDTPHQLNHTPSGCDQNGMTTIFNTGVNNTDIQTYQIARKVMKLRETNFCSFASCLSSGRIKSILTTLDTLTTNILYLLGAVMAQGLPVSPRAQSSRLFTFCWLFLGVTISATYTGNLVAFLTVQRPRPAFGSLSELVNQEQLPITIQYDAAYETLLESHASRMGPDYEKLLQRTRESLESNPALSSESSKEFTQQVLNGSYAIIEAQVSLLEHINNENNITFLPLPRMPVDPGALGFPEGCAYTEVFSEMILKLTDMGHLQRLKKQFNLTVRSTISKNKLTGGNKVGLLVCSGAFLLWAAMLGLSSLVFLLENMLSKTNLSM